MGRSSKASRRGTPRTSASPRSDERIRLLPKRNAKVGGSTIGALLDAIPVYRNETKGHGEPDSKFRDKESVVVLLDGQFEFEVCRRAPHARLREMLVVLRGASHGFRRSSPKADTPHDQHACGRRHRDAQALARALLESFAALRLMRQPPPPRSFLGEEELSQRSQCVRCRSRPLSLGDARVESSPRAIQTSRATAAGHVHADIGDASPTALASSLVIATGRRSLF